MGHTAMSRRGSGECAAVGAGHREVDEHRRDCAGAARSDLDFAVVVGVEDYPYFQSLRGAATDARSFHAWLVAADGGGLQPDNAKLILSDLRAETPVQDEIDQMLVEVLDAAYARGGAHRLYFYFAGHGATNPERTGGDVALLLARWSRSLARLALSTERYANVLCGAGLFEEVAIFIDCCRSLSVSAVGVAPTITRAWQAPRSTRTFLAYATEAGRPAFECPDSDLWQGIFTRSLLCILRRTPSGVGARALKDLLESEVETQARRRGVFQCAHVENGLRDTSYFGRGGTLPQLELRFRQRRGSVVLRGGNLEVVAEHQGDDSSWRLPLPVGLYLVEGGGQDAVCVWHDGREVPHDV